MTELTLSEKLQYMKDWCAENKVVLEEAGECGFGRPCVGILYGNTYVDYTWEDQIWTPEDSYHKTDCLAVLVHPKDSDDIKPEEYYPGLEQLYRWVKWLNENNWIVTTQPRETYNKSGFGRELELMMGSMTQAKLVKAT